MAQKIVRMLGAEKVNVRHHSAPGKIQVEWTGPSPYSPDLAPSDFHLFLHLKKHLAWKKFDDDDEMQEEIITWFKRQAADFYYSGI
jgi:hypothetical protein